ncbi:MAG: tyrosine-type recombinase/integrase, partial [bacterium]|nr:tyrosine-type recombinase/integrase [bacterium]
SALFRTLDRKGRLTERQMTRNDALRMIKRRAKRAGLPESTCCHTFRATGITTYLENGGTLENAQAIAAHASTSTTKLYDRTRDDITLEEVERNRPTQPSGGFGVLPDDVSPHQEEHRCRDADRRAAGARRRCASCSRFVTARG